MVTARTPSPIDAVLPEYIALHESTGESFESIADRVEEQGAPAALVERLRKFDNDSEAYKVNQRINREAERAGAERKAAAENADAETAALRDRVARLESLLAGQQSGSTTPPKGRQAPPADKA
jgi:hypothetical protein